MDKNRKIENGVGIQMIKRNRVELEEAMEKRRSRQAKTSMNKGGE
jgi:hypothetical protein